MGVRARNVLIQKVLKRLGVTASGWLFSVPKKTSMGFPTRVRVVAAVPQRIDDFETETRHSDAWRISWGSDRSIEAMSMLPENAKAEVPNVGDTAFGWSFD